MPTLEFSPGGSDTVPLSADQPVASAESHLSLHNPGVNYENHNTRGAAREGEPGQARQHPVKIELASQLDMRTFSMRHSFTMDLWLCK